MTRSSDSLHNIRKYNGKNNIQISNGSNIPITTIGDIGPSFRHVFVSPRLSNSLFFVGKLVDNNRNVHFSWWLFCVRSGVEEGDHEGAKSGQIICIAIYCS